MWKESEHPRDEEGKFVEKKKAGELLGVNLNDKKTYKVFKGDTHNKPLDNKFIKLYDEKLGGFWFTDVEEDTNNFGGITRKGKIELNNPINIENKTLTENDVYKLLKETEKYSMPDEITKKYAKEIINDNNMESDYDIIQFIKRQRVEPDNQKEYRKYLDTIKKLFGYDGYITKERYMNGKTYVIFDASQFKEV